MKVEQWTEIVEIIDQAMSGYMIYWTIDERRLVQISDQIRQQLSKLKRVVEVRIFNTELEYHVRWDGTQYSMVMKKFSSDGDNLTEHQYLDDRLNEDACAIMGLESKSNRAQISIIKEVAYDDIGQAHISSYRLSDIIHQAPKQ